MSTLSASKTTILAIDQGTHASRALLFDDNGGILSIHYREISLNRKDSQRVEQDPEEIIASLREVIWEARQYAAANRLLIRNAGISTQRSSIVAWDKISGKALYPTLSWQDTRAQHYLTGMQHESDKIKMLTGLPLSAHYGASKFRWLLENIPDLVVAAESERLCLGPLSSFILHRLIKRHPFVVDHCNASRTLLWNLNAHQWEPRLLKYFRIWSDYLPSPQPIRHNYGRLENSDICVAAVNGDQPSALFGQALKEPESAVINIGSGAFIMCDTGAQSIFHPYLLTAISDSDHQTYRYCLEGTVNGAGTSLQWAEKQWGLDISEKSQLQKTQDPPVFINTVGGLGSPWWHSDLMPRLHGLISQDCRRHSTLCLAAILESIVFMLYANLEQMAGVGAPIKSLSVTGGVSRYRYLSQALADLSGLRVYRSEETEMTARGIAWLASGRSQPFPSTATETIVPRPNPSLAKRYHRFMKLISEAIDVSNV